MPISQSPSICPLCHWETLAPITEDAVSDRFWIRCQNCGDHWFSGSVERQFAAEVAVSQDVNARRFYAVRRLPSTSIVTADFLWNAAQNPLPGPLERIDNLVIYLATEVLPGEAINLADMHIRAIVGAQSQAAAAWTLREVSELGYVAGLYNANNSGVSLLNASLNARGWNRYLELVRDGVGSKRAFMAMRFGDDALDAIVNNHFKPAAARAGFDLRRVDEPSRAGLIDNQMRVDIRTSRFVVCDLSHGNRGAYWEAGFAEGIGRPVIYTCRKDVFDDKKHPSHPHFDIVHQSMIIWEPENPTIAARNLTNMIRATLPAESIMEDQGKRL